MKRLFIALALCLCSAAYGGDYGSNMQLQPNGYYLNVNALGQNDGWFWQRVRTCGCHYNCYCYGARWTWVKVYQIPVEAGVVSYSKGWKDNLITAIDRKSDNQQFRAAVRESGLVDAEDYGGYGSYQYGQGFSIAKQGYGYQSQPYAQPLDIGALFNLEAQAVSRAQDYGGQASANLSSNVREATEIERIRAARDGMVEIMKAAQTNKTEYRQWHTQNGPPAYPQPEQGGQYKATGQGGAVIQAVRGETVAMSKCAKCHSGAEPKAGFDITPDGLAVLNQVDRADRGQMVYTRVRSKDPNKSMPPPNDENHGTITAEELVALVAYVEGQQ